MINDTLKITFNTHEKLYINIDDYIVKNPNGTETIVTKIVIQDQASAIKEAVEKKKDFHLIQNEINRRIEDLSPSDRELTLDLMRKQKYYK